MNNVSSCLFFFLIDHGSAFTHCTGAKGFIKTRFSKALWDNPALRKSIESKTPAGRVAEPEEVSGLALYLASEASNFTTGAVLTVDGGYTLT